MAYLPPITRAGPPTTSDDTTKGCYVGGVYVDTTARVAYICVSAAIGAAIWTVVAASMLAVIPPYEDVVGFDSSVVITGTLV